MHAITNTPLRLLLTAIAIAIGVFGIGIIATLMMYYHLRETPISPAGPTNGSSPVSFWLLFGFLVLIEIFLTRWLRKSWREVREHRKRNISAPAV